MDRKDNIGTIALIVWFVVCAPFALFGLYALSEALRLALAGPGAESFWDPLAFGVVFSAMGWGLIFLALYGKKRIAQDEQLEAEHPGEPWLWRADWARGRVKSTTRTDMVLIWIVAIAWNLVSVPACWSGLHAPTSQKGPLAYIVLAFPAAGLFLLYRAVKATIALFEFGTTYFDMASVPAVIGRELKGAIEASFPHSPEHGVHLRLSCVHRVTTGSGKTESRHEYILWRDEADLDSGQLCAGPRGTTIPVTFQIPVDAHATEKVTSREEYFWRLEALADMPGVNYHDAFEVPVFWTPASPKPKEAAASIERRAFALRAAPPPEILTVKISERADGREFYFPAARNAGTAMTSTFFALVLCGLTVFLVYLGAILFSVVFGFFAYMLLSSAAREWLRTTRVTIGTTLKVQSGLLGGGKVLEIAFSDVAAIDDKISTRMGTPTATPYVIVLQLRDGRSIELDTMLSSKREAEWLVSEFRKLMGVETHAAAAGA